MTKREYQTHRMLGCGAIIAALVLGAARPSPAADANLCVTMSGSNGQVGGLQMDLVWDGGCMTAVHAQGDAAKCRSNPATGKNVQTKITGNGMRAIFLSMSDNSPAPDGDLFCCAFTTSQAGQCCSVNIGNLILASPTGARLYASDLPDISIEAQMDGTPCTAAQPGGSQANPVRPPAAPMVPPPAAVVPPPAAAPVAPGGGAPVPPQAPAQNVPRGMPPVAGGQAAAPTEEAAPAEAETPAAVTPRAVWTATVRRTPVAPTATPQVRTPQPQPTATVAATAATPVGPTPTAPAKGKAHKKHKHTS